MLQKEANKSDPVELCLQKFAFCFLVLVSFNKIFNGNDIVDDSPGNKFIYKFHNKKHLVEI